MISSAIEWTDDTVNLVEGCTEVDTDCSRCFAKGIAARFAQPQVTARREEDGAPMETKPGHYDGLARLTPGRRLPQWTGRVRLRPDVLDAMFWRLLRARSPRRQFLCSMGDIFHREVPDSFLDEVFARIAILESRRGWRGSPEQVWRKIEGRTIAEPSGDHPIYMLTKRPERAAEYTNATGVAERIEHAARSFIDLNYVHKLGSVNEKQRRAWEALRDFTMPAWPLRSVALITSAGTQAGADARVPHLLRCKAAMRGVSCEPMTGPVDFRVLRYEDGAEKVSVNALTGEGVRDPGGRRPWSWFHPPRLDWVIVGGESGDLDATREELRPRPCNVEWMSNVVSQCQEAGVPVFVKQLGNVLAASLGRDGKGGALEDLPPRLRVRQFPRMGAAS
ncbi:MAG: DUF5131 family protein [Acidobacteriota bacterium]